MDTPLLLLKSLTCVSTGEEIGQVDMFTFSYVLGRGALPVLKKISIKGAWEKGAVPALLRGLSEGACPLLHTIDSLLIPFYSWDLEEDGDLEQNDDFDEEETDNCMKALTEMLEARHNLVSCVGFRKIGGNWLDWVGSDDCGRIFWFVLPTLEELPECEEWEDDVLHEFVAIGAPRLKHLKLQQLNVLVEISNKPEAFMQLQEFDLILHNEGIVVPMSAMSSFSAALAQGAWPQLQRLSIKHATLEEEGWKILIGGLSKRRSANGCLQELIFLDVKLTDNDIAVLADAFAAGGFSSLKLMCLAYNNTVTDVGAACLAKVLHHAPLLETLKLNDTGIRSKGCGAVAFAVVSECPAMKKLVLPCEIGESAQNIIKGIVSAANGEATLTVSFV